MPLFFNASFIIISRKKERRRNTPSTNYSKKGVKPMNEYNEIATAVAVHEERINGLDKRVEEVENITKTIQAVNVNVVKLSDKIDSTNEKVVDLKADIAEFKNKPKKVTDTITVAIITAITSGLIGYFLSSLLS